MRDAWFRFKLAVNALLLRAAAGLHDGEEREALLELADGFDRLREAA